MNKLIFSHLLMPVLLYKKQGTVIRDVAATIIILVDQSTTFVKVNNEILHGNSNRIGLSENLVLNLVVRQVGYFS